MLSRQQEPPTAHILLWAAPPQLEPPAGPVSYFHVEIHPRCPGADTLPVQLLFERELRTNLTALPGLEETLHFPSNLLEPLYHFHNWDLEQWLHLWLHCFHSNLYSIWIISLRWLGSTGRRKKKKKKSARHFCIICNQGKVKACTGGRSCCSFPPFQTECLTEWNVYCNQPIWLLRFGSFRLSVCIQKSPLNCPRHYSISTNTLSNKY